MEGIHKVMEMGKPSMALKESWLTPLDQSTEGFITMELRIGLLGQLLVLTTCRLLLPMK